MTCPFVIKVPEVVVGDQSAGKSSIVQALCGVSLTRSQGTTTRCPFRITTSKKGSSSKSWICYVSLQQQSDLHGRGQWRPRDELKITHFATIYDEAELEAVLRRAQLALLNPQSDPKHFLEVDWTKHTNNKAVFSPNILSLEIQASNLPELEFYDIPGCINSYDLPKSPKADAKQRQKEEKDLIQMIKTTVVSYIKEENCLVLLACSADQDLEMSLTMKYVRDNEAEHRCIGVLTKADLVPLTKIPVVLEILEGEKPARAWVVHHKAAIATGDQRRIGSRGGQRERNRILRYSTLGGEHLAPRPIRDLPAF
jgi:hypothetical protein